MAKVFRLHRGQDGTGWFVSQPLNKNDLKTIKTAGKDVATSIPSPFAQIDLVKSAFQWVVDNGIEGKSAQHKLVSDALDIAQLFYSSHKYKDQIEITAWSPKDRFKNLIDDSNQRKHSKFAETLRIFWDQDSVRENDLGNVTLYNFEQVKRLYFIRNKDTGQVIGGTSPATLFFAAPDAQKAISGLNITLGSVRLFTDEYSSLNKREPSFIEYIYALAKQARFSTFFPEVYSYIEEVRQHFLTSTLQSKVTNLNSSSIKNYPICPVLDNVNNPCEVLGIQLGVQIINGSNIGQESDFVIESDLPLSGQKPLVLPFDKFSKQWIYTTKGIIWNENTHVPVKNFKYPKESKLPTLGDQYYWLTIGNFLEEKIIELPYSIDSTKFNNCNAKKYLLPLTPTFFEYFMIEKVSEYLKLEELAGGGIEAKLEIPVRAGKILFKKTYHLADIEKLEVHLAILPFVRVKDTMLDYTIGVIDDRSNRNAEISIGCYEKGKEINISNSIVRNPGNDDVKSYYYKISDLFDVVRIGTSSVKGVIVPMMKPYNGSNQITFAIDFGTTNTHIEYVYGQNVPVSLDNSDQSPFWQSLMNRKDKKTIDPLVFNNEETFEKELMPFSFSKDNTLLSFPVRTALVHNRPANFNESLEVFRHTNNYLLFEKWEKPNYLELFTQLKWSNYADNQDENKVKCYIEYLMRLVYYKTLLLDGDTSLTKIIWFYPVSMDGAENSDGELGVFIKLWNEVYGKIFKLGTPNNLIKIPESIAPYLFYKSSIAGLSLSIDIGGGSSDIAVFDEHSDKAILISSFKFAGNSIFGDGFPTKEFKNDSDRNGFVKSFLADGFNIVGDDQQKKKILEDIVNVRKDSADFSSFLFSLEKDVNKPTTYTRLLEKNKRVKLSLLIFYGAIAYYSANLLNKSGIRIPKYILLSGTASKTASILDSSGDAYSNLSAMFSFIFSKVYSDSSVANIKIELSKIPKEITCKGALKGGALNNISQNTIKFWIGSLKDNKWGTSVDKEKDIKNTPKYKEIDGTIISDIKVTIVNYYQILDEYVNSIRFESKYLIDADAYEIFKRTRNENIEDYLVRGMKAFNKKEDKHIEETLFFYPLIGILNKLAFDLSKKEDKNAS